MTTTVQIPTTAPPCPDWCSGIGCTWDVAPIDGTLHEHHRRVLVSTVPGDPTAGQPLISLTHEPTAPGGWEVSFDLLSVDGVADLREISAALAAVADDLAARGY